MVTSREAGDNSFIQGGGIINFATKFNGVCNNFNVLKDSCLITFEYCIVRQFILVHLESDMLIYFYGFLFFDFGLGDDFSPRLFLRRVILIPSIVIFGLFSDIWLALFTL